MVGQFVLTSVQNNVRVRVMIKTMPITKVREELTSLVKNASDKLAQYIITVNGSPSAVLLSAAEYESWKETNDILADPGLVKALKRGETDLKKGKFVTFEQLKKELKLHV